MNVFIPDLVPTNFTRVEFSIDPYYEIEPLRRTQVMILPFCEYFDSFETFENVIQSVLEARMIAMDLITDVKVEKLERESAGLMKEKDKDWE